MATCKRSSLRSWRPGGLLLSRWARSESAQFRLTFTTVPQSFLASHQRAIAWVLRKPRKIDAAIPMIRTTLSLALQLRGIQSLWTRTVIRSSSSRSKRMRQSSCSTTRA